MSSSLTKAPELKQERTLFFKPFTPLVGYKSMLIHIDELISSGQFESALQSAQELIRLALGGLHYFQTYDWLFLKSTVVIGYLGWIVYVFLHILQSYTNFPLYSRQKGRRMLGNELEKRPVRVFLSVGLRPAFALSILTGV